MSSGRVFWFIFFEDNQKTNAFKTWDIYIVGRCLVLASRVILSHDPFIKLRTQAEQVLLAISRYPQCVLVAAHTYHKTKVASFHNEKVTKQAS